MRQGHLAALLGAAVALTLPAAAQIPPIQPAPGMLVTGTNATITPTAGTAASTVPALAGRVLTPADFGAVGDTQRVSCTVTTAAASPTVTITGAGCGFTAADIGKNIVIFDAGASLATAPIASDAVNSAGSAYTTVPTITITDATGGGAVLTANEGLATATVATGGATCTDGVQTFTVSGGTNTSPAQFTGTVTANALSGALTVTVPGNYQALPSVTAASVTGGGCGTAPTISNTWLQLAPTVTLTGYNYTAPTAAYSTGNATLQNPVLATPGLNPLASTISNVSGTTLTLADNASQTITTTAEQVTWGHDDAAAINAMIAAIAAHTNGAYAYAYFPPAPGGFWGAASTIQIAPGGIPIKIIGAGRDNSQVLALASMSPMVNRGTGYSRGGTLEDIAFDGNKLTTNVGLTNCLALGAMTRVGFYNAAPYGNANLVIGEVADEASNCNGSKFNDLYLWNSSSFYTGDADLPFYNLTVDATDNFFAQTFAVGASIANIYTQTNAYNTAFEQTHVYGPVNATSGMLITGGKIRVHDFECDNCQQHGIYVNAGGFSNFDISSVLIIPSSSNAIGVRVAPSVAGISVQNVRVATSTSGVKYETPLGVAVIGYANSISGGSDLAANRNPLPFYPNYYTDITSIGLGPSVFAAITTAVGNTAVGYFAMPEDVTGSNNSAFGRQACRHVTGLTNSCFGAFSGQNILGGSSNNFFGELAGGGSASTLTGNANNGFGVSALTLNAGGQSNSAFGNAAGSKITTGSSNTIMGAGVASTTLVSGSNNVLIGTTNNIDTAAAGTSNTIAIGAGSTAVISCTGTGTPGTSNCSFAGTLQYQILKASKTGAYAVLAADSGTHFDNIGAGGSVTFTLPAAAAGLNYCFLVSAAQTVVVTVQSGEKIAVGTSNSSATGNITATTAFSSACIEVHAASQWVATSTTGTWAVN